MEGVTTAVVAFIFVCLIWPQLVKEKAQFYAALILVLVVILLDALGHLGFDGLGRVMYVLAGLVQIVTIVLLVLCVGGLTVRQFGFEVMNTVQTFRRGGEEKPVIVPTTAEKPAPSAGDAPTAAKDPPTNPPPSHSNDHQ